MAVEAKSEGNSRPVRPQLILEAISNSDAVVLEFVQKNEEALKANVVPLFLGPNAASPPEGPRSPPS